MCIYHVYDNWQGQNSKIWFYAFCITVTKIHLNENKFSQTFTYRLSPTKICVYCCIECSLTLLFFIMVYLTIYACRMFVYKQSGVSVVVFNATFNNFSYIVPVCFIDGGDQSTQRNHRPAASYWQTLSHNVESSTPRLNIIWSCNYKQCGLTLVEMFQSKSFIIILRMHVKSPIYDNTWY